MKEIVISVHAAERMELRGTTKEEVITTIERGDSEPARKGRTMYRKNFTFDADWRGKAYNVKQVARSSLKRMIN